jgi:hypothetical protein
MKHLLEDEYVSYNVHLAPIFEYEAPVGVSLRGLGAGDLGAIFLKFCKLCGSPPNEVQKTHTHNCSFIGRLGLRASSTASLKINSKL